MREGRLEDARRLLVRALGEYAARTGVDVTVVFDAHGRASAEQSERVDGVSVRYGSKRASADHVIERLAYEAMQRGEAIDVVVATSDRLTRDVVGAMGVPSMSALALQTEVDRVSSETAAAVRATGVPSRRRVEDHLSDEVRRRLEAIRRGSGEPGRPAEGETPQLPQPE
jgi:predicted RNA-binding protein with PIN domain